MSNRLLGILILIGFIGLAYLYYQFKYLPLKEELNNKNEIISESNQEKEIELVKISSDIIKLTPKEKINQLKLDNKNYATFNLNSDLKAYFKQKGNILNLYLNDDKIGSFDLVYPEFLDVSLVLGTINDLYIKVADKNYLYNNNTGLISDIDLNIEIDYIKKSTNSKFIIVTQKGSFIYYLNTNKLEYFSYFNDFIHFNNSYLGLVKSSDSRILKNLGFETVKNLVVYYNPFTKEKNIVYETDLELEKIYIENDKLFISTIDDLYEIKNVK